MIIIDQYHCCQHSRKYLKRLFFPQLYEYFNKNNLLYKSQYGFRTLHSTELASLEIIDIIGKDLDNGKLPIGVFLDLSKAFDTLDHTILLDKLLYYGIKGTELAWFKSYLTNRTQFVSYNDTNSRTLSITTGVPQGSILGPLLFIFYMNDIHNTSSKFHAILFADDTNLTSTLCSFDVNIDNNCNSLQLSTNINKELTHHGPVTQYCGGSILCKIPIFFIMKEFPQIFDAVIFWK